MKTAALATLFSLIALPALAATASFKTGDGTDAGSAALAEGPTGVLLRLELTGLPEGWHGIHFHSTGDCSDAKFMNSGGHINHAAEADKAPHGLLNPDGPDFGDLPNIHVGADGTAKAEVFSALVSLTGAGERPALLDDDGAAIVIHEAADDHKSQPIGGAGARIACAVVEPAE
jgi:Cu-Zn family superoxide dismutase